MADKRTLDELAIFGGTPAFATPRFVGRPNIGDRDKLMERITGALDRVWLTNDGPLARELEAKLSRLLGVRHCMLVCNATVGLEIAIRALDLRGEVIVPSFTFAATAHALAWLGLRPIFCDVGSDHVLDPRRVEPLITSETSAILGVHLWGRTCNVEALTALAKTHGLRLFFDAAHALGCSRAGQMVGGFGDLEVFSFHATKFFNSFEGGVITTNDDALAMRVKLMRNFGFAGYDQVVSVGTNGKMSEVSAAMGLTSFDAMATTVSLNESHYERYQRAFAGIAGAQLIEYDRRERNNFQYVVLELQAAISRDQLVKLLWAENVHARRYFAPGCHDMEPYRALDAGPRLPVTQRLVRSVLALPTGTGVTSDDVDSICALVRFAVEHGARVASRMS